MLQINAIDENKYSKIANKLKEKLDKYNILKEEGCSEKVILQVIDISRATLFIIKVLQKQNDCLQKLIPILTRKIIL